MSTQKDIITKSPKCNFLTKEQYDAIADHAPEELWCVESGVVVESWCDDTKANWYVVFSDGLKMQSGKGTSAALSGVMTFHKEMETTTYWPFAYRLSGGSGNFINNIMQTNTRRTTNFTANFGASETMQVLWFVIGH